MFLLPDELYKTDTVHRVLGNDPINGVLSCGFINKKTKSASDNNIIFQYYGALLLLSGEGTHIDSEGKEYRLYPGCFIQRIPGKPHSTIVHPDGKWVEFFICFGKGLFDSLCGLGIMDKNHDVLYPGVNYALLDMFINLQNQIKNLPVEQLTLALSEALRIIFIIYQMHQQAQSSDESITLVKEACSMLQKDFEIKLPFSQVCHQLGVGYESFRKIFKKIVGFSPIEYRVQSRINVAKSLLLESDKSIKQIAYELGFPDSYSFSAQFRRYVGVSPTLFRKKY